MHYAPHFYFQADFPRSKKPNCYLAEAFESSDDEGSDSSDGSSDEDEGKEKDGKDEGRGSTIMVLALRKIKKGDSLTLAQS